MTADGFFLIAFACALACALGFAVTIASAVTAVTRHPHYNDARRARKRYTVPALVGMVVAVIGGALCILALIVAVGFTVGA